MKGDGQMDHFPAKVWFKGLKGWQKGNKMLLFQLVLNAPHADSMSYSSGRISIRHTQLSSVSQLRKEYAISLQVMARKFESVWNSVLMLLQGSLHEVHHLSFVYGFFSLEDRTFQGIGFSFSMYNKLFSSSSVLCLLYHFFRCAHKGMK